MSVNNFSNYIDRKQWIDFGKGISMFLVILYHSECYYPITNESYSSIFAYFRMPFFFILSGYLFTSNFKAFSIIRKFKQIFRGIVWTYIIFTSIIIMPKAIVNGTGISEGIMQIFLGYASWFVVALGVAQAMFAIILHYIKNLKVLCIIMLLSLMVGYIIKLNHPDIYPFQFDKAFIVLFFVMIGFFYRVFEDRIHAYIPINKISLAVLSVLFFTITFLDKKYLGTTISCIQAVEYNNFVLSVLYALVGSLMLIFFVKCFPAINFISFIGINSLVFYYLNGGVIKVLRIIYNKYDVHLPQSVIENGGGYVEILFMAISTCVVIAVIVKFIKHYCPLIIGDKKAFNKLMKKLKIDY